MWRLIVALAEWGIKKSQYKSRLESKVDDIMRRTLRLEIFEAIRRKDTKTVYELGDVYLGNGFNSYVSQMIADYKKTNPLKKRSKKC